MPCAASRQLGSIRWSGWAACSTGWKHGRPRHEPARLYYGRGYRTPHFERLGKAAARLDDVLNFLPARVGALVLCCIAGRRWRAALDTWRKDGRLTSSPNAGQTMACAAGALGVRLEKSEHYILNAAAPPPGVETIARARQLVARAMWLTAGLALLTRVVTRG